VDACTPEIAKDFEAVAIRQAEIENHQIQIATLATLERRGGRLDDLDGKSVFAEAFGQRTRKLTIVLDENEASTRGGLRHVTRSCRDRTAVHS